MIEKEKITDKAKLSKIQTKPDEKKRTEVLVRIFSTDIPGNFSVYHGLTKIKGISWAMSNAICNALKIDKQKKIAQLSDKDIEKITNFIHSPSIPEWLLNRRKDEETGESKHLLTTDLDFARESDIRKMKKIKSYKGWRHALGQPVRGQRTKSHFRKGTTMGVMRAKIKPGTAAAQSKEKK
ncbi:MAG: 30S ribosomal protein S13 [Candidatus Pacearchaeota archaeon]